MQKIITFEDAFGAITEIFEDLDDSPDGASALSAEAKLTELGLESISLVYLISELQQRYDLGDSLFRKLREESLLLKEMSVGDVVSSVVALGARA